MYGMPPKAKGYTGVQCKCPDLRVRGTLTPRQLRGEVAKARRFSPSLKQYVIATPLPRDPKLQQLAREITMQHRRRRLSARLRDAARLSVHDQVWQLSLNYGNVLEWKKQPKRALQYYGAAVEACIDPVDR